ncbi:MAG TPA: glycerol-3-phosphate acyltransferase [Bacillales bacterium]|nr:glycerol-3-phosphate acyltransferase [Bacillales bacterium]
MVPGTNIAVVVASYLLGCVTAGYYLVRLTAKKDIHELGSGNVGARNVGRILGPAGFAATFLFDFGKGIFVVWAARKLGLNPYWLFAAFMAVIIGHMWPLQLRFRGGRGFATAVGVMLMLNPLIWFFAFIPFLCLFFVFRSFTISALAAFVVTPFTLYFFNQPAIEMVGVAAISAVLIYSHRENLAERVMKL